MLGWSEGERDATNVWKKGGGGAQKQEQRDEQEEGNETEER